LEPLGLALGQPSQTVAVKRKVQPTRRVSPAAFDSGSRLRWVLLLGVLAVGVARASDAEPRHGERARSADCSALVPVPWPTSVIDRRLQLRRMEAARAQCIGDAHFLAAFGALWLEDGDAESARVWLERSLMLYPDDRGAQADHALALAALGEPTALQELVQAWRFRTDVPLALRQRIGATIDPRSPMQLPTARLGGAPPPLRSGGRGEASVLVGYDTNLTVSPRLTELTLTPPTEDEVVLPVTSTPRRGAATKVNLSWESAWELSDRQVARTALGASARRSPGEDGTNWHQLYGAAGFTQQWNGWSGTAQLDGTWFGGALTEPYGIARLRLILEHIGENCSHTTELVLQARRQSETRTQDSSTLQAAWQLRCRPGGSRAWSWSVNVRAGSDRPNRAGRPGGAQQQWGSTVQVEHRPSALTALVLTAGAVNLRDAEGYSALLQNNAIRRQSQAFVAAEVSQGLNWSLVPGAEAVFQLTRLTQDSNLPLFRHQGTTAYMGLRWPW
jgi:hypothetical protein